MFVAGSVILSGCASAPSPIEVVSEKSQAAGHSQGGELATKARLRAVGLLGLKAGVVAAVAEVPQ